MRNKEKSNQERTKKGEKHEKNRDKNSKWAQRKDQRVEILKVSSTLVEVSMRRKRLLFQQSRRLNNELGRYKRNTESRGKFR